jgi:recombination protein RecT
VASKAVVAAKPIDRFKQEIALRKDMMLPLLPKTISYEKFEAMVIAAVGSNPKLLECDRASLLKACIQASELGLSLNPTLGEGDILQVWDNKTKSYHAQFRPRYMGLMKLARQSGMICKIEAEIVRENDEFLIQKGDEPRLEHRIKLGNRGDKIGAYCIWTLKDGAKQFEVMDREQILAIRDRSSAKTREGKIVGPWATDEEEMWRKTVVRRASKYMPRATDAFSNAVTLDNLHEAGHDVEFEGGEIIDITEPEPFIEEEYEEYEEAEEPAPAPRTRQKMDDLANKVAQKETIEIERMEVENDNFTDWCERAGEVVHGMTRPEKVEWYKLHRDIMDEAELLEPSACAALLKKLK